jgi:hypothetical protein
MPSFKVVTSYIVSIEIDFHVLSWVNVLRGENSLVPNIQGYTVSLSSSNVVEPTTTTFVMTKSVDSYAIALVHVNTKPVSSSSISVEHHSIVVC